MLDKGLVYRGLRLWLALVSVHSVLLGVFVYMFAEPFVSFHGFDVSGGLFYPRQSGAFLLILGVGYGLAAIDPQGRKSLVFLTLFSKVVAVGFLFTEAILFRAPPLIFLAGIMDSFLGGVLLVLAITFYRERRGEYSRQGAVAKD